MAEIYDRFVGFEVITAGTMKKMIWVVTPLVLKQPDVSEKTYLLVSFLACFSNLEAIFSFEMSGSLRTTRWYN
jgi:hypothetical protein